MCFVYLLSKVNWTWKGFGGRGGKHRILLLDAIALPTRKYPRAIQELVSTYNLPKPWGGGWYSGVVKTQNTQSAKICLNFNFAGGGEGGGADQIPE